MSIKLVQRPTVLPVSVELAKANSNITHSEWDVLIESMIWAALDYAERITGMKFAAQTWDVVMDAFPASEIMLPVPPVTSVVSVNYINASGFSDAVNSTDYRVDLSSLDAWVVPVAGFAWPAELDTINAVSVRVIAGDLPLPPAVQRALLLIVGHWINQRETVGSTSMQEIPFGAHALLGPTRRMFA